MSIADLLPVIRRFRTRWPRVTALVIVAALIAPLAAGAAAGQAAADERARIEAAAAAALEQKYVDYFLGALDRLQPFGTQLVVDTTAWATSGSSLLTAADVAGLESTRDAVVETMALTPPENATSDELESLFTAQWTMITGARERFGYFVERAAAAAKVHLDAAPIADSTSRKALTDAIAALESAEFTHAPLAEHLTAVTSAASAVDAAQAAAVAAAAAAAAAAARKGGVVRKAGEPVCASDLLTCVNQIRSFYGVGGLSSSAALNGTAQDCANILAAPGAEFKHTLPLAPGVRGENIARGYSSQVAVFNAWMGSAGHRANILRSSFTSMGLGYASGNNWCQQFS